MSQETTNTQETKKDSGESAVGTPANVLSQESIKLKCLELAIETDKTTPEKALFVAKEFYNWVVL